MIRIAGAPITWGVCEVPGWGHRMSAGRVLAEMAETGLSATEFGPDGFLPRDPAARSRLLAEHGLTAVGGFVPVVLHRPDHDPLPTVLDALAGFGPARTLVLAAATGDHGYDRRPELDARGWDILLRNLERLTRRAADAGVSAVLHPHVGTLVEGPDDITRVLDGSAVPLCLDTGHLLVGGSDPVALAVRAAERVAHVHLKDVDAALAGRVRNGETGYAEAVRTGLYRPLGAGDIDIAALVSALGAVGYDGWYVLEQDTALDAEPAPGDGPLADVRTALAHLDRITGTAGRAGAKDREGAAVRRGGRAVGVPPHH
ncbi:TIM barrel protein [Streptomyces sp. AM 4-1-1]|uniref:TIM barrel protein n=1 Tax=Streptomyces sp. AM 4-1-1 TaxID=3028710 RepID=UPI0023BA26DD|nr:TIM barrel protein [Streptomyces sp. AM 4-1-1]WEH36918.1 TIM barrel protein [Streptomyces sp. AM 4-1-1]